jgi:hypothetical protein
MQHLRVYKLAAAYKMKLMHFLVNIHINNQSTLYKVNGVVDPGQLISVISVRNKIYSLTSFMARIC